MDYFIEFLKAILYSFVEGVSQMTPISSSGHYKFFNTLLPVDEGIELFYLPLIQFFAVLGIFLFFVKLVIPRSKSAKKSEKKDVYKLWINILVAIIPTYIIYILYDLFLAKYLTSFFLVCMMLIIYGGIFLILEFYVLKDKKALRFDSVYEVSLSSAFLIGLSQILALIPGTSRLGVTLIAALLLGFTRTASISFSFLIALPLVLLESLYKVIYVACSNDYLFSGPNTLFLITSCILVFLFTFFTFKYVYKFFSTHTFKTVGYYRVSAGILFLLLFFYALY